MIFESGETPLKVKESKWESHHQIHCTRETCSGSFELLSAKTGNFAIFAKRQINDAFFLSSSQG